MDELRAGLWTWTGRHPDWPPGEEHWGPEVRSYALVREEQVLLFDPITPPHEVVEGRRAEIVLTAEWHKRSSPDLGLPLHDTGRPTATEIAATKTRHAAPRMRALLDELDAKVLIDARRLGAPQ